jgi:hypothetical protein
LDLKNAGHDEQFAVWVMVSEGVLATEKSWDLLVLVTSTHGTAPRPAESGRSLGVRVGTRDTATASLPASLGRLPSF